VAYLLVTTGVVSFGYEEGRKEGRKEGAASHLGGPEDRADVTHIRGSER